MSDARLDAFMAATFEGLSMATITIPVSEYRSMSVPGLAGAKLGECIIKIADLPDFDDWLSVNPRIPKRNTYGVLTGAVINGIRDTMDSAPQYMVIKNLGIYISAEHVEWERKNGRNGSNGGPLTITFSDPAAHGIVNGGHTYAVFKSFQEDMHPNCSDAYVRLHIFQGIPIGNIPDIAEGLNKSKQVDDPSLENLRGTFDDIRRIMHGLPGAEQIAYRQGDPGEVDITEILHKIELFNFYRYAHPDYDNTKLHPHTLYRHAKTVLAQFVEDCKIEPVQMLINSLPDILVLSDKICKALPSAVKEEFQYGRMKIGNRTAKIQTRLYFLDDTSQYRVLMGWLCPMLAAFRANIDVKRFNEDVNDGIDPKLNWIVPIDDLINEVIENVGMVLVNEHRESNNNGKVSDLGKKQSIYQQCYTEVRLGIMKLKSN